ncbi:MAG: MBL fold metallo-hydrolase [Prevotella sp.]|nr:MBL fold metallo-hydrolase [Alistipes senegalensis]MCM1358351.1 MBL fold metallo-hydrolase [Prevotella sp.]
MKKFIILVLMMAFSLFSCEKKEVYPDFTVDFLDVGKADSMVLRTENSTVVIDCGEKGDGKQILELLAENEIESVDYLIITHYDKDHVGGAAKLINNIEVKNVLAPDYTEESGEMEKYHKALDGKNITPVLMHENISFTLDGVEYTVYAPEKDFYGEDDDNDFSLVTKAVYHDTTLLFTGDAMEQRLEEIMDIGKCTLLKVPYHARKIKNLEDFISRVRPKYAVSCTSESEFSSDTEEILNKYKIKSYATCYNGRITAVSNGNDIKFSTQY